MSITEIKKCAADFEYFCHYLKVPHPQRGNVDLELSDCQKELLHAIESHPRVIAKKFRQGGFTTLVLAYALWRLLFKPNETNIIVFKSERDISDHYYILSSMISSLPDFIKPELDKNNLHTRVNGEMNSKLLFLTPEATRGHASKYLFIEEAAFIKDLQPNLASGNRIVAVSTVSLDDGWFYKTFAGAGLTNDWFPLSFEEPNKSVS